MAVQKTIEYTVLDLKIHGEKVDKNLYFDLFDDFKKQKKRAIN